jgi:hypothetical protein
LKQRERYLLNEKAHAARFEHMQLSPPVAMFVSSILNPLRQQGNFMSFFNLRIRGRLYGGFGALLLFCAGWPALPSCSCRRFTVKSGR